MREVVTVGVGQAGNQIAERFISQALQEHADNNANGVYDSALSSFFQNVSTKRKQPLPVDTQIHQLTARASLIDTENSVTSNIVNGALGEVIDSSALIATSGSGSGNNFAQGMYDHSLTFHQQLVDTIRRPVEQCDSLQGFMMLHSLGGGSGSGVGSALLHSLRDEFPDAFKLSCCLLPSENDDVVISPYNALLSTAHVADAADCVLPLENQALIDLCEEVNKRSSRSAAHPGDASSVTGIRNGTSSRAGRGGKPFDGMNGIAGRMLLNLTAGARFGGDLNVDLGEAVMNLMPFPRLNFACASMSPLVSLADVSQQVPTARTLDHTFQEAFSKSTQLVKENPRMHTYLASALMLRGNVAISEVSRNISKLRSSVRMASWSTESFKVGLCTKQPHGLPYSLMALSNNCCMGNIARRLCDRYSRLRSKNLYMHHYTRFMDADDMDVCKEVVKEIQSDYDALNCDSNAYPGTPRAPPAQMPGR